VLTGPDEPLFCQPVELSADQRAWLAATEAELDEDRFAELVVGMVDIPSPTGEERALAEYLTAQMATAGLDAQYQPLDELQGNALGHLCGQGDGPNVLLYAPIDTLTAGRSDEDCPWAADELRADMLPRASRQGRWVTGLGASNPKGHGACLVAVAEALKRAGVPLRGSVILGLGAGGMPTNRRSHAPGSRRNVGQGVGCSYMIEQGVAADYAIIAKPGWSVAWEEVGLTWFKVTVRGTFNYVGSRHRISYRNAIVDAGAVICGLEEWFVEYSKRHTDGLVAPQAQVGNIRGGWERTASLSPAQCHFTVDVRTSPRTTTMEVYREFAAAMKDIAESQPELQFDWSMVLSIPGTKTAEDDWIVRSLVRAWEDVEQRPHEPGLNTSGATDANILRARGIRTARIGMPKAKDPSGREVDFALGMNAVDLNDMRALARLVLRAVIDTAGRTWEDVERLSASAPRT
jgi:acetylornithine deacetylase/succinyl-diaminopimelate desuccinylase-like protein